MPFTFFFKSILLNYIFFKSILLIYKTIFYFKKYKFKHEIYFLYLFILYYIIILCYVIHKFILIKTSPLLISI